jgi:hypothetical protein
MRAATSIKSCQPVAPVSFRSNQPRKFKERFDGAGVLPKGLKSGLISILGGCRPALGRGGEMDAGSNAEFAQSPAHCSVNDGINSPFVLKLNLSFRRVNIDVDLLRVDFKVNQVHGEMTLRQQILEGNGYCMVEVGTFDKSLIDEKELFTTSFFSHFRLAHKTCYRHYIRMFFDRDKFLVVFRAEHVQDALSLRA